METRLSMLDEMSLTTLSGERFGIMGMTDWMLETEVRSVLIERECLWEKVSDGAADDSLPVEMVRSCHQALEPVD